MENVFLGSAIESWKNPLLYDHNATMRLITSTMNFARMEKFIKRYKMGTLAHIYPEKAIKQLQEDNKRLQSIIDAILPDLSEPIYGNDIYGINSSIFQVLLGDDNWYDFELEINSISKGEPNTYGYIWIESLQAQRWFTAPEKVGIDYKECDCFKCPMTKKHIFFQVRLK